MRELPTIGLPVLSAYQTEGLYHPIFSGVSSHLSQQKKYIVHDLFEQNSLGGRHSDWLVAGYMYSPISTCMGIGTSRVMIKHHMTKTVYMACGHVRWYCIQATIGLPVN